MEGTDEVRRDKRLRYNAYQKANCSRRVFDETKKVKSEIISKFLDALFIGMASALCVVRYGSFMSPLTSELRLSPHKIYSSFYLYPES